MSSSDRPITVFYSYAHADEKLRDELAKHLSLLKNSGYIHEWHDRDIEAGQEWEHHIDQHLETAHLILLLISADFMASRYCYSIEMQRAMQRHEAGAARVIPIILRPVDWQSAPFGKLQALPKDAKAVTTWPNQDEAFFDIAQGIRRAVAGLRGGAATASPSAPTLPTPPVAPAPISAGATINTGGGAYIGGSVNTGGGTFVGRDQINMARHGVSLEEFRMLLTEVRQLIPLAGVEERKARIIENDVAIAEEEAQAAKPDSGLIVSRLEGVAKVLKALGRLTDPGAKLLAAVEKAIQWGAGLLT